MTAPYALAANVSLLFTEISLLKRFAAASDAGFGSVEAWWPFDVAQPSAADVDRLVDAIAESGSTLTGLNFFAGDMPGGERGIVCRPDRQDEFTANLDVVMDIAIRTGCRSFNALYGQRQPGMASGEQDSVALRNLSNAVRRLSEIGGTVLIEPLSRGLNGAYPIETTAQAATLIERVHTETGLGNIALLFDTFHLANNGEDLSAIVAGYSHLIGHVQVADTPGRGEPGTGRIDFATVIGQLQEADYRGLIACEYVPTVPTLESLSWVADIPTVALAE
jgi:hydroxypyruvate isomerase